MNHEQSHSEWLQLLAAAKQGDRDALGELLQAYWAPLWEQAAMRMDDGLRSKQAASDVVQETVAEAHLHIREFRGSTPAEFQAWLRTMLTNNIRDAWRRYSRTQKRQADREIPLAAVGHESIYKDEHNKTVLNHFLLQEKVDAVQKSLQRLPEHYREVIQMRHWEGMTFEAIGEKLGKSTDSVRQLWYRALEHFSQLIEQDDV